MQRRHFPPPSAVEQQPACFVVRDHSGQQLAHIYFEDEPGRRSAAKLLTCDEGRRIAANIAKYAGLTEKNPERLAGLMPLSLLLHLGGASDGDASENEPHPMGLLASIGKFFDHSCVDRSLSVQEANEVRISDRAYDTAGAISDRQESSSLN